ncbi:hypothetical protein [Accumulibacter sp.]|uniref:hypothetical protein n=1 Tax=Accumulibacter sp. TaxID=2053492 RepID=UPI002D1FA15E|nr:hypothetical protein [Accumulibacter sp.]
MQSRQFGEREFALQRVPLMPKSQTINDNASRHKAGMILFPAFEVKAAAREKMGFSDFFHCTAACAQLSSNR